MVVCDVCGNNLRDDELDSNFIGIEISLKYPATERPHKELRRIEKTFGRLKFDICYVCWLKSLGIKPLNG